ncbi:MAG: asparaginase [Rhodospirillales bacterium]|nr:asparaginase [Rhodospirillales bacterium]
MLPRVAIFAMGGTIAMAGRGERGVTPSLGADALVEAVPQLAEVASIEAETFRLLPSPEVTIPDLFALADAIEQAVADGADGVVVTHGTDTMEESAFLLDRILDLDAPVVLTGAMRNPTLAGPDGPANLLNGVRLAVHEPARGLGVMVVMNDEIHAARYVRKTVTSNPAAFRSAPAGPLGWFAEGAVRLAGRPGPRRAIAVARDAEVAPVALLTVTLGDDGRLIERALDAGYQGIVMECTGGGHAAAWVADKLADAAQRVPVVMASRTGAGEMLRQTYDFKGSEIDLLARGMINAGWLDGLKARLLLTLLLMAGGDDAAIREEFSAWLDPDPAH